MYDWFLKNYEWFFSGLGVTVIILLVGLFQKKNSKPSITNNIYNEPHKPEIEPSHKPEIEPSQSPLKSTSQDTSKIKTTILFIDDEHTKFKMVSILKKAGWANTKSIKDLIDLDDPKAIEADFIFVDINGVGTTVFEDQGLGLASALKKKYPHKKIILYSAESNGDRFHRALREVDNCLQKNAEPYQFISLIEELTEDN